jgi:hypothetical protein
LTAELDQALTRIERMVDDAGRHAPASAISSAHARLAATIGTLHLHSTRVPAGG